ncbi:MAG TPA: DUF3344 domain-containing protein [Methanoregulaceae archaeon]|nr:DUF3344 domain-containing protein [Methanoregulaceae archaeon]
MVGSLLLALPAAATYAGDRPLAQVFHEGVCGGYLFVLGNGTYSGTMDAGSAYDTLLTPDMPGGSETVFHRIYVYWSWSKKGQAAVYPRIVVELVQDDIVYEPVSMDRYLDNKGFASQNDFYSGMDSCELPGGIDPLRPFLVSIQNGGEEGATFTTPGVGFLAVYSLPGGEKKEIWVLEGADLLYSRYGITPEMATSRVEFPGTVAIEDAGDAELFLVAPSGGYSLSGVPEMNRLFFNRGDEAAVPVVLRPVMHILFPSFSGKTWTDIFTATDLQQIGTDRRSVKSFIRAGGNRVEVQDNGDYLQLTNAVLEVSYGG